MSGEAADRRGVAGAGERMLTVPEPEAAEEVWCTGNEWVSLPVVRPGGEVERFGVLHAGAAGLVECLGAPGRPLVRPWWADERGRLPLDGLRWRRIGHWALGFEAAGRDGWMLSGRLWAPPGHKGFCITLEVRRGAPGDAEGGEPAAVRFGLEGTWLGCEQSVYTARPLEAVRAVRYDRWCRGPVFEARAGLALVGWAWAASEPPARLRWRAGGPVSASGLAAGPAPPALTLASTDTSALNWQVTHEARLGPGEARAVTYFCGVNREADGARTTAVALARRGAAALWDETVAWLEARTQPAADAELSRVLNENLFFNRFFALGRCIDSEAWALVTSRSPRYYVSAAFWARDALLWSFPAVLLTDPGLARTVLVTAFERTLGHPGIHSLYMDGGLLYPGFELDELCAYCIAYDGYVRATGDDPLLEEPALRRGFEIIAPALAARRHPDVALYSTELDPSDDPAVYPYPTYGNALAKKALEVLARVHDALAEHYWATGRPARVGPLKKQAGRARREAEAVAAAIRAHLVVDGPFGPMFAWSTDLRGNHLIYDEPPGSLQLLSYYGLCPPDDPVYMNTVRWIHSAHNPYRYEGAFPGVGCPHSPAPFVMGLHNDLLSGIPERRAEALDVLRRAPLDTGLACESFDARTGRVHTGAAFATCAGFLAYALARAAKPDRDAGSSGA